MPIDRVEIFASKLMWNRQVISLFIERYVDLDKGPTKARIDRAKLEWVPLENPLGHDCNANPTAVIDMTAAQKLMDYLWDCGLRPTEGQGSAGQLSAVQAHLQDMRTLALGAALTGGLLPDERKQVPA